MLKAELGFGLTKEKISTLQLWIERGIYAASVDASKLLRIEAVSLTRRVECPLPETNQSQE